MRIKRLRGKTIGIIGFGRIGQAVAEKASVFGLKILASDPFTPKEIVESSGGKLVSLEELLENSDFVSLHAPLTPDTEKMIGPKQFDLMKGDAFLINAARGPLIDEAALYEALSEGKIGGAGLDVMVDNEPSKDHPLMQLENILITPHTAFFSQESTLELEERAASEVVRVYRNSMPENLVNPEVLEHPNPKRSLRN
jgi:D-3-phosphoglycerate dehydrogenase